MSLRIAIDLDGTAWKHSKFFKEFVWAMMRIGHEIIVLTATTKTEEYNLFLWEAKMGYPYIDFYISKGNTKQLIGEGKRDMCKKYEIDHLFDDFGGNNLDIEKTFFEEEIDTVVFKVIPGEE